MQAVILVGGKGTRIQALYRDRPKPLVPVLDKPFLQWQIEWLSAQDIRDIHLAAGHMGDRLQKWAGSDPVPGTDITVSIEPQRLGTGGGLKFVEPFIRSDPFFVLNGDSLSPAVNFQSLENTHTLFSNHWKKQDHDFQSLENTGCITVAVTYIEKTGRYGTVEFDSSGHIQAFLEKADREKGWINAGIYVVDKAVLGEIEPSCNISMETELFPLLTAERRLFAADGPRPLLDMGTPEGLRTMEQFLRQRSDP
jgi:NDP-sugar pyrophosphorylase family protein